MALVPRCNPWIKVHTDAFSSDQRTSESWISGSASLRNTAIEIAHSRISASRFGVRHSLIGADSGYELSEASNLLRREATDHCSTYRSETKCSVLCWADIVAWGLDGSTLTSNSNTSPQNAASSSAWIPNPGSFTGF